MADCIHDHISQPSKSILHQIVLVLGVFHTEMSFLGKIGTLMAGTELKEFILQVYADGSVDQIMSGKAVARSVGTHILVDSALNVIISLALVLLNFQLCFSMSCVHTHSSLLDSKKLLMRLADKADLQNGLIKKCHNMVLVIPHLRWFMSWMEGLSAPTLA